jgi:hypothetical protein
MSTVIKRMRATKNMQPGPASKRLTHLHYITGISALALACFSALCIYFYTTPAHASSGNQITNGSTSSARVVFDDTETNTSSRTPTNTPSATVTSTSTPVPSPSATRATTPSPTSTRSATATAQPSSTATGKQTPTSVNVVVGAQQTPVASPVPTHRQSNQASQDTNTSGNSFPVVPLVISLASLILLGVLLKGWRAILRPPSPGVHARKLPIGAVSTSRAQQSSQQDAIMAQRAFNLSVPLGGVLTRDQFAQAVQQRTMNMVPPLPLQGNAATNSTPYTGTAAGASFYSYPGIQRPGGFMVLADNQSVGVNAMPTLPNTPVPAANQPALQAQTPGGPSTDDLEVSNPSMRAWVQTYIY